MKICFITTVSSTFESFILPLTRYIHENTDWKISLICSDEKLVENLPDYVNYYPVTMKRGISFDGLKAIKKMMKIFDREKFDIVQYSTPNASCYASIAAKLSKVPVRLYCQWGIAYVGFSGLKRKIFKLIEKMVCKLSTWIEPDSISNLNFAHNEELYPKVKGSVVWNGSACGVNLSKFNIERKHEFRDKIRTQYNISDDKFVYIFIGRVTRDKGINELLTSFKEISSKDNYLFLVGNNEVDSSVNEELYKWSLEQKNIIYTGNVNNVEEYLSAADCYVLPSYREGFGMSVVEAEAMGVPVIVTRIPGPIDAMVENETGLVVEKENVEELTSAMKTVLNMDLISMGNKGSAYARDNFEQSTLFKKILEDREYLLDNSLK